MKLNRHAHDRTAEVKNERSIYTAVSNISVTTHPSSLDYYIRTICRSIDIVIHLSDCATYGAGASIGRQEERHSLLKQNCIVGVGSHA